MRPLYCKYKRNPRLHIRAPAGRRRHHAATNLFYFTFEQYCETVTGQDYDRSQTVTLPTASTVSSLGHRDTPRAVSSFVITSTCESSYLYQGDTNIVLPTDYREKAILHVFVQSDVLGGVIGLYVGQLLDREVLTRKSAGNCT